MSTRPKPPLPRSVMAWSLASLTLWGSLIGAELFKAQPRSFRLGGLVATVAILIPYFKQLLRDRRRVAEASHGRLFVWMFPPLAMGFWGLMTCISFIPTQHPKAEHPGLLAPLATTLGTLALIGLVSPFRLLTQVEAAERSAKQAEAGLLQARLAPHFLFNTLATVQAQLRSDPESGRRSLSNLGNLFDQVLVYGNRPLVNLAEELSFVETYLSLQSVRLGSRLRFHRNVQPTALKADLPPLSLQVLVENAIKHGVSPYEDGGDIVLNAELRPEGLWIQVQDAHTPPSRDAVRPRPFEVSPGTGTALATLRQRLSSPEDLVLKHLETGFRASFTWRQP